MEEDREEGVEEAGDGGGEEGREFQRQSGNNQAGKQRQRPDERILKIQLLE